MLKTLTNILAGSIYAVADSLLLFLSYTKDPIIPVHLHDHCIAAASNFLNCKQVIICNITGNI